MTQCDKIFYYMKQHGGITSMECFDKLKITRLSARIYDLRNMGIKIKQERKYENGTHYDIFSLEDEKE